MWVLLSVLGALPAPVPEAVAVVVVEAGRAPRRELRLGRVEGWRQEAVLSVATEEETDSGAEQRTEYGPEVSMPLTVLAPTGGGEGRGRYHVLPGRPMVRAPEVEGGAEQAWRLAEALAPLHGSRATLVLEDTGQPVDLQLPPALRGLSERVERTRAALAWGWCFLPHFPEEPVGEGARWVVSRLHGPGVLSVVAYELVSLRGTQGRVRFKLEARLARGGREPSAEGELRFDLARPVPDLLEVRFTQALEVKAERGGHHRVEWRVRVRLEARTLEPLPGVMVSPAVAR